MNDEAPYITIHPGVKGGAPCIGGAPTEALASLVWAGDPVDMVAADFDLTRTQVLFACWHEARNGPRRVWTKPWEAWAEETSERLPCDYSTIPDPPSREAVKEAGDG